MSTDAIGVWQLLTPAAFVLAVVSGGAYGWLVRSLRPAADPHAVVFLAISLGVIWYVGQWVGLFVTEGSGWGTLARWAMFEFGFVPALWAVLRWKR